MRSRRRGVRWGADSLVCLLFEVYAVRGTQTRLIAMLLLILVVVDRLREAKRFCFVPMGGVVCHPGWPRTRRGRITMSQSTAALVCIVNTEVSHMFYAVPSPEPSEINPTRQEQMNHSAAVSERGINNKCIASYQLHGISGQPMAHPKANASIMRGHGTK